MKETLMKIFNELGLSDGELSVEGNSTRSNRRTLGLFSVRRSNIGKAFGLSGEIRELSKLMISALFDRKQDFVDLYLYEMKEKFEKLLNLDLPADFAWQIQGEAGQEYVEAQFTKIGFDIIVMGELTPTDVPKPSEFGVTEPCWLAGIGDAVTELSRIIGKVLLSKTLSKNERIAIRERFIAFANECYDSLSVFENAVPQVINNSRRRGFGNTYRGLLGRIRGSINQHTEKLVDFYDQSAS